MNLGPTDTVLARCADRGFTPGVRDVQSLLALWEGEGLDPGALRARRKLIERALFRGDVGVARKLLQGVPDVGEEQLAMRLRVLARIGRRIELAELPQVLLSALGDGRPRVVREAARAVGKLEFAGGLDYEEALLSVCRDGALPERKAAVEALGRLGAAQARAQLDRLPREDAELSRRIDEAITLIDRRVGRSERSVVVASNAQPQAVEVLLRCRAGAAAVVADQARSVLGTKDVEPYGEAAVKLRWSGTLDELYRVRTAVDVALQFSLPESGEVADRIVASLQSPDTVRALSAWTEGPVRFRLAFAHGGRRRAVIKKVAQQLTRAGSVLLNDSREGSWTMEVDEAQAQLICIPRGADTRFSYRRTDLPSASHPSLAALLAWLGQPKPGERVWDPFCGTGSELIECAMLARGLHLWGTDVDPTAIEKAQRNFAAAEIEAADVRLEQVDVREVELQPGVQGVSLILANPPMGRRIGREGNLRPLLGGFVQRAARMLAPGGRVVWVTPLPKVTADAGRRAGLLVDRITDFDMGGFEVVVQQMRKRGGPRR
jgi:predicted RNA methylase